MIASKDVIHSFFIGFYLLNTVKYIHEQHLLVSFLRIKQEGNIMRGRLANKMRKSKWEPGVRDRSSFLEK